MLPESKDILSPDFKLQIQPSKTYELDMERKCVSGAIDGLKALEQAVFCILSTERFRHLIYSWNYGTELNDLYGSSAKLVKSRIQKRIREALTQDDRIEKVDQFTFLESRGKLTVGFTVHTAWGKLVIKKEVSI